jgi:hypothetical protein
MIECLKRLAAIPAGRERDAKRQQTIGLEPEVCTQDVDEAGHDLDATHQQRRGQRDLHHDQETQRSTSPTPAAIDARRGPRRQRRRRPSEAQRRPQPSDQGARDCKHEHDGHGRTVDVYLLEPRQSRREPEVATLQRGTEGGDATHRRGCQRQAHRAASHREDQTLGHELTHDPAVARA